MGERLGLVAVLFVYGAMTAVVGYSLETFVANIAVQGAISRSTENGRKRVKLVEVKDDG